MCIQLLRYLVCNAAELLVLELGLVSISETAARDNSSGRHFHRAELLTNLDAHEFSR